jgi:hypothetical protein
MSATDKSSSAILIRTVSDTGNQQRRQNMDWVRVEEGLPPRFQFVQMYDQARNIILVGFLDKDGSWISYNRSAQIVSHWMPVPNIPIDVGPALYKRAHRRASHAHAGQNYAGRPYIKHLEKVAARFEDVELRVIALLNGVLTDPTPHPLRDSEVSLEFGFPVLYAVQVLTRSFTDTRSISSAWQLCREPGW